MICSVGIALALLGNFFLAVAAATGAAPIPRDASRLTSLTPAASHAAVAAEAAFLFLLVGYGTEDGARPAPHLAARRP